MNQAAMIPFQTGDFQDEGSDIGNPSRRPTM